MLRTVAKVSGSLDLSATLYDGMASLPHFNPDDDNDDLAASVRDLRVQIRNADAVLFCTPEYAGALPGSFKNLLDWAVGDDQVGSLNGKAVAWINVSLRGAVDAHESLRKVLGYLGAVIVEPACVVIPVDRAAIGDDGLISSTGTQKQIVKALTELDAGVPPHL